MRVEKWKCPYHGRVKCDGWCDAFPERQERIAANLDFEWFRRFPKRRFRVRKAKVGEFWPTVPAAIVCVKFSPGDWRPLMQIVVGATPSLAGLWADNSKEDQARAMFERAREHPARQSETRWETCPYSSLGVSPMVWFGPSRGLIGEGASA